MRPFGTISGVGTGLLGLLVFAEPAPPRPSSVAAERRVHSVPESKDGDLVVGLCDGQTAMEVDGVKAGQSLTRAQAQTVSDQLMAAWKKKNPRAQWDPPEAVQVAANTPSAADKAKHSAANKPFYKAPSDGGASPDTEAQTGKQGGHTYGAFTERDEQIWKASTEQFVAEGHRVFHDAKALGGTVGISCDMCHPDAANTHPETYPKFQVQLGRVALLRDMMNWCIENPVRGKPLADNDERLRAMEAYIYAQRKGKALEAGKRYKGRMAIEEGSKAPAFKLKDQRGSLVKLSDFKGKHVVLYFYPKDNTPGCTKEACDFRDQFAKLRKKGAVILGISPDGEKSHQKFIDKYDLPFPLLVDEDHAVAAQSGAWGEKSMYGRKFMGIPPVHVLDRSGRQSGQSVA